MKRRTYLETAFMKSVMCFYGSLLTPAMLTFRKRFT